MNSRPMNPVSCRVRTGGFTLIEVLVTLLILTIVLPVLMRGISASEVAATDARYRTEASALAESRLAQIVASQQWQSGNLSGDFPPAPGSTSPNYHWQMSVGPMSGDSSTDGVEEIDLTVSWVARNKPRQLVISTLAYPVTQEQNE